MQLSENKIDLHINLTAKTFPDEIIHTPDSAPFQYAYGYIWLKLPSDSAICFFPFLYTTLP